MRWTSHLENHDHFMIIYEHTGQRINEPENGPSSYRQKQAFRMRFSE